MRSLLVINPGAGRAQRISPEYIVRAVDAFGLEPTTIFPNDPQEALSLTRAALSESPSTYERVIVAGGDGTINSILPAVLEASRQRGQSEMPLLGILPVGSVNVLARELGIPPSVDAAADIVAHGEPRIIDLGLFQNKPFALMAGLGFDAATVSNVRQKIKRRLGSFAYILEGLRLVSSYSARRFQISCDEETLELKAWQVVIANANNYTYRWKLVPHARIDDGLLEVCIFPDKGKMQRLRQCISIVLNRPHGASPVYCSGHNIRIRISSATAYQLDGDAFAATDQAEVSVLPKAINILTPTMRN